MPSPKALPELKPLEKHIRLKGKDRDKLTVDVTKHYNAGVSVREISEALGRSFGFVHNLLEENGVELRRRGGAHPRRGTSTAPPVKAASTAPKTKATMAELASKAAPAREGLKEKRERKAAEAKSIPAAMKKVGKAAQAAAEVISDAKPAAKRATVKRGNIAGGRKAPAKA